MIGFLFILLKSIVSLITLTILYLISIKPRLHGRPDYKPFFGHMYAHRGLHNMSPAIQKLKNLENIDNASEKLPEKFIRGYPARCRPRLWHRVRRTSHQRWHSCRFSRRYPQPHVRCQGKSKRLYIRRITAVSPARNAGAHTRLRGHSENGGRQSSSDHRIQSRKKCRQAVPHLRRASGRLQRAVLYRILSSACRALV